MAIVIGNRFKSFASLKYDFFSCRHSTSIFLSGIFFSRFSPLSEKEIGKRYVNKISFSRLETALVALVIFRGISEIYFKCRFRLAFIVLKIGIVTLSYSEIFFFAFGNSFFMEPYREHIIECFYAIKCRFYKKVEGFLTGQKHLQTQNGIVQNFFTLFNNKNKFLLYKRIHIFTNNTSELSTT